MMRRARTVLLVGFMLCGCATLAEPGGGEQGLPGAAAGPFRPIRPEELGNSRAAPYALRDEDDLPRDVSVLDADGDPATLGVYAFAARTVVESEDGAGPALPPNEIVRFGALDARSFDRSALPVLRPELEWEGGTVGAPSALRVGAEIWLYYAAAGGIGLATSDDGLHFVRRAAPVLAAIETHAGVPRSPAVVQLWDGTFRMFYELRVSDDEAAIGEAASGDGVSWKPEGAGPVLSARKAQGAGGGAGAGAYDAQSVAAPFAVLAQSALGRPILWLYYAATDAEGRRTIALAGRYGEDGPFGRALSPVFGMDGRLGPTEPCVLRYPGFALLFATERAGKSEAQNYPAVAAGVAPATVTLPPPEPP
ncbi:MAG: hypothetical protein HY744_12270 [Deltaproteobacteria bacterium]|nr:hypothetical protein [Deltaproteobacteria bacterium]